MDTWCRHPYAWRIGWLAPVAAWNSLAVVWLAATTSGDYRAGGVVLAVVVVSASLLPLVFHRSRSLWLAVAVAGTVLFASAPFGYVFGLAWAYSLVPMSMSLLVRP